MGATILVGGVVTKPREPKDSDSSPTAKVLDSSNRPPDLGAEEGDLGESSKLRAKMMNPSNNA